MSCNSGFPGSKTAQYERAISGNVANLALFQKFEDFMDYFEPIVHRFPSYEKNTLCVNIINCMYRITERIIKTNRSRDKAAGWYDVDTELEILRSYVRRSRKKGSKYLSIRSYETAVKKLSEVGRILGGLIKKGNQ
ncbi:MAG: diversity-generating retroelement protein Avd [Spirochaetaceae bacterium]|jgi:hypothetical protein|nr:diversity-generating retroelement protein Avd [Spirochaetaceae bacterium]